MTEDLADVADVTYDDAGGVRWAFVTLRRPAGEAAPVIAKGLREYRVVTDDEDLVQRLVDAGGRIQRRAHDYAFDLATAPDQWAETPAPQGFRLTQAFDAAGLVEAHTAANPPGHPDHQPELDHLDDLTAMIAGKVIGPLVTEASWQVEDERGPCGAVLVVDRTRSDGSRVAWVVEVFVHPRHQGRGLGRVLLQRAVAGAREAGHHTLGLVVSDGNPARAAYDAVGFTLRRSGTNVDLP